VAKPKFTDDPKLHKDHRQRVRKRYINEGGLDNFDDHQVLELLLFYAYPMIDTNEIAHKLINDYDNLSNLLETNPIDIMQKSKVTENVAVLISLVSQLSRWYFKQRWRGRVLLDTTDKLAEYAVAICAGCFFIVCLDVQNRHINTEMVSRGTVDELIIFAREVVQVALRNSCVQVVLAHNHPGGSVEPSREDYEATKQIKKIMEMLGITVKDHIIVSGHKYYSMANKA
jgi:DNA repair protein RadC